MVYFYTNTNRRHFSTFGVFVCGRFCKPVFRYHLSDKKMFTENKTKITMVIQALLLCSQCHFIVNPDKNVLSPVIK